MSRAITLARHPAADPVELLRGALVLACAASLILAGAALPL